MKRKYAIKTGYNILKRKKNTKTGKKRRQVRHKTVTELRYKMLMVKIMFQTRATVRCGCEVTLLCTITQHITSKTHHTHYKFFPCTTHNLPDSPHTLYIPSITIHTLTSQTHLSHYIPFTSSPTHHTSKTHHTPNLQPISSSTHHIILQFQDTAHHHIHHRHHSNTHSSRTPSPHTTAPFPSPHTRTVPHHTPLYSPSRRDS